MRTAQRSIRDQLRHGRHDDRYADNWVDVRASLLTEVVPTAIPSGFGTLNQYYTHLELRLNTRCNSVQWQAGGEEAAEKELIRGLYYEQHKYIGQILRAIQGRDAELALKLTLDLKESME